MIYNVEASVGQGGANRRLDVMLVQYFLSVAQEDLPDAKGYRPPGQRPIAVDGACGPQTVAYIRYFQEQMALRYGGSKPDGRVDPCPPSTPVTSTGVQYTIVSLNTTHKWRRGVNVQADIRTAPNFPAELIRALYIG